MAKVKSGKGVLRYFASLREKCNFKEFPNALGIGAASFWSEAEKDIAESPTASPERPK